MLDTGYLKYFKKALLIKQNLISLPTHYPANIVVHVLPKNCFNES